MIPLQQVVAFLDEHLSIARVPDYPNARNGLQVERDGAVKRVAFAVDAGLAVIEEAGRRKADLLVVHHGLFWGGLQPIVGPFYKRVHALMEANIGLYSAHLPLDVHPEHGNNVLLARALGIEIEGTFADYGGTDVGMWGVLEIRREALAARLDAVLGCRIRMIPGGSERIRRVGVITGGAGSQIAAATRLSLDAFVTGEVAHHHYFDAMEGGINVYVGGHYATEVWGVRALGRYLEDTLGLECSFIDHPTGL